MMCTGPCVYPLRHSFIDETDVLLKHIFMSAHVGSVSYPAFG